MSSWGQTSQPPPTRPGTKRGLERRLGMSSGSGKDGWSVSANIHASLMPVGVRIRLNRRRPFAMGSNVEYDLVVIGSGPGGQKAAIAAAKLGKSVAVVERGRMLGGVCVNTGTIPSKTLREAVVYLTGMSQRELYGASYRVKEKITPQDLLARTSHVITKEVDVVRSPLLRNRVALLSGHGRFLDPHTIEVEDPNRRERLTISGKYIVIATGTKPLPPSGVEFDENRVLDSDGILDLKT